MQKQSVILLAFLGLILLCIATIVGLTVWRTQPLRAMQICNNLLQANLLTAQDECTLSRDPTVYLPAMFPPHEVDIDYVTTGMQGFERLRTSRTAYCEDGRPLTVMFYALAGMSYVVDFAFCNIELVNISYSD
jgi:hypothetical protein